MVSKMAKNMFKVYSFYRFKKLSNLKKIKNTLNCFFEKKKIRGTILIAEEGINASISGKKDILEMTVRFIKKELKLRKLEIKVSNTEFLPFNRIKVRVKKEIVSLGIKNTKICNNNSYYLNPDAWDQLISQKNVNIIDTRNDYEIKIGNFKGAINPKTKAFREFPKKIEKLKLNKKKTVGIYCTGGIRCEKAYAYLKMNGYKSVYQLQGGIINYLKYKKRQKSPTNWKGECFVFDNRVTVNNDLEKGKFEQCFGCRMPLSKEDLKSKFYKKGVHCHHCIDTRSDNQIKKSEMRQSQIEMFDKIGKYHVYKKQF